VISASSSIALKRPERNISYSVVRSRMSGEKNSMSPGAVQWNAPQLNPSGAPASIAR
jgi:hypothetical protein